MKPLSVPLMVLTNMKILCTMENKLNICSVVSWGGHLMTDYEKELLYIIQSHDNPEQALEIAVQTIIAYLERPEPF